MKNNTNSSLPSHIVHTDIRTDTITEITEITENREVKEVKEITEMTEFTEVISANPGFGFHSIGSDGRFIQISQTELDWLGYKREEVVGKLSFYDLLTDPDKKRFQQRFPVFQQTGIARDVEYNWVGKDGSIVPISVNGTAIKNKSGEFMNTATIVINLSQRKRIESAAREVAALKQKQELQVFLEQDIQNPIASSNKLLKLILAGGAGNLTEQQKKIFTDLKYTNDRVLKKMKVLLETQRADEEPLVSEAKMITSHDTFAQQMPLWKVVEGCVIRVARSSDFVEKQLAFELDLNSSSIIVDTHAFQRLISHLLENAARFSPLHGVISIGCVRELDYFELIIKDQGAGFQDKQLQELSTPIPEESLDNTVTALGIFLCSRIVEAYGGEITCGNQINSGAVVTVRIPM
jgi:PAS domain S-box-containing protein